jgi:hypothetical protein
MNGDGVQLVSNAGSCGTEIESRWMFVVFNCVPEKPAYRSLFSTKAVSIFPQFKTAPFASTFPNHTLKEPTMLDINLWLYNST